MLSYCLRCRRNTESKNTIKNGRLMVLSNRVVCNGKKLRFIKNQEGSELLSSLTGVKVLILRDMFGLIMLIEGSTVLI